MQSLQSSSSSGDALLPGIRPRDCCLEELDSAYLLFHAGTQKLLQMDEVSAAIWRHCVEDGVPPRQAACGEAWLLSVIEDRLAFWQANKLFEQAASEPLPKPAPHARLPEEAGTCVSIAGLSFEISGSDAVVADAVDDIMGHLRLPCGPGNALCIVVERRKDGAYLITGPMETTETDDADGAAVCVKGEMIAAWVASHPESMAVHAAALGTSHNVTLLAGASGSGKTTLAALLCARGLALVADDAVFISEHEALVRGAPFAFAVKPGALPILESEYAGLRSGSQRARPDGKIVRYAAPAEILSAGQVRQVLFPRYRSAAELEVKKMSRAEALVRLLSEAFNGPHRLSVASFRNLCAILRGAEVRELTFGAGTAAADYVCELRKAADEQS